MVDATGLEALAAELAELLERMRGWLVIGGGSLRTWYPEPVDKGNRPARLRVNDLVYRTEAIGDLLALLPAGKYDGPFLRGFAGVPAAGKQEAA